MELGEFILNGPASDIAANQRVAASYLGFQHEGASDDLNTLPSCPAKAGHPVIRELRGLNLRRRGLLEIRLRLRG